MGNLLKFMINSGPCHDVFHVQSQRRVNPRTRWDREVRRRWPVGYGQARNARFMTARIAVTGIGLVSPLGLDVPTYWRGLLEGRSGVTFIREFPTDKLRSDVAAMVPGFDPSRWLDKKEQEIYGRVEQLSVAAADEAVKQARLDDVDKSRVGGLMSTRQRAV